MARTLEDVFIGEFKRGVSNIECRDIFKVPLPPECNDWVVSGTEEYLVKGVNIDHYSELNGIVVKKLPNGSIAKRRVIDKATRSHKVDGNGNYIYEDVVVPQGSMVVVSQRNLKIPYKDYAKHQISAKDPNYGYGYIDFIKKGVNTEYMYIMPKSCLYRVNQTALALSVKNMKNYSGMGYTTWNSGVIYLHVIPYNPKATYIGSRILKTGINLDYDKEITKIQDYWQQALVIPNITMCSISTGNNLVLRPTMVGYEGYVAVDDLAVGEREIYGSNPGFVEQV